MATHSVIRVLAMMEAQWVTGPAKNLIAFATHLRSRAPSAAPRVELSVIAFDRPSSPANRFLTALQTAGIPVHVIRERCAGDPRVIPQLLAIIRSQQPDILQTHNSKSHLLARLTRLSRRVRWIAFHHGFTAKDRRDLIYNRLGLWGLRSAPRVVTVCEAFSRGLCQCGIPESRISVHHNIAAPFVEPPAGETAAARARLGIPPEARVLLAVGRLSSEKGHRDLLQAMALVRNGHPDIPFRLVLVGDGPERGSLERQAVELGLTGQILFVGHQEDVRPYYGLSQVFVLPSHSEGSPNVLLEAMAAGLPIVSTAAGGAAELVSNEETALVVECGDPEAFGHAVARLLEDQELGSRLGAAARIASQAYTPEAYAAALIAIYQEAIGQPVAQTEG